MRRVGSRQLHRDAQAPQARLAGHDQPAVDDAEVPVAQPVADEDQRRAGQRALDLRRQQVFVARDGDEEVEVVVLGQHERLREAEVTMEVVHDRVRRARRRAARVAEVARLRPHSRARVPPADLAPRLFAAAAERLVHEVVVVGRDVDRQRQVRQDRVRLVVDAEVGRRDRLELGADELLRVHRVVLMDADVLRHARQVVAVIERIGVLAGPAGGELRAERQRPVAHPRAQEGRARPGRDPPEQQLPVGVEHGGPVPQATPC